MDLRTRYLEVPQGETWTGVPGIYEYCSEKHGLEYQVFRSTAERNVDWSTRYLRVLQGETWTGWSTRYLGILQRET